MWGELRCPIGCWRVHFSWSSPWGGLSYWSVSGEQALWPAAGTGWALGWRPRPNPEWWRNKYGDIEQKCCTLYFLNDWCAAEYFLWGTSGGVFVGGVTSEALDEAFDGEGLTDSFESLSASLAPLPFTWEHRWSSASILIINTNKPLNVLNFMNILPFKRQGSHKCVEYQASPQGGSLGFELTVWQLPTWAKYYKAQVKKTIPKYKVRPINDNFCWFIDLGIT